MTENPKKPNRLRELRFIHPDDAVIIDYTLNIRKFSDASMDKALLVLDRSEINEESILKVIEDKITKSTFCNPELYDHIIQKNNLLFDKGIAFKDEDELDTTVAQILFGGNLDTLIDYEEFEGDKKIFLENLYDKAAAKIRENPSKLANNIKQKIFPNMDPNSELFSKKKAVELQDVRQLQEELSKIKDYKIYPLRENINHIVLGVNGSIESNIQTLGFNNRTDETIHLNLDALTSNAKGLFGTTLNEEIDHFLAGLLRFDTTAKWEEQVRKQLFRKNLGKEISAFCRKMGKPDIGNSELYKGKTAVEFLPIISALDEAGFKIHTQEFSHKSPEELFAIHDTRLRQTFNKTANLYISGYREKLKEMTKEIKAEYGLDKLDDMISRINTKSDDQLLR